MLKTALTRTALLATLLASFAQAADDCADYKSAALSGDWSGRRTSLCEQGITVDLTHKSDLLANVAGGVAQGSVWLMNSEAALNMDMDKFVGWHNTSAFVHYHIQHGAQSINSYTGSFSGVSNLETSTRTGQFFQAWLQKNSDDGSLSLLGGLYAVDSEFYVTDTSGLFLQPPYGMSTEMSQTGRNGPPIYPTGALGVRLKYSGNGFYLQAALTDGVPGNPGDAHGTQIRLDEGDGTLAVAEFAYTPQGDSAGFAGKTALGVWRYTARADDLSETDAQGNPLQRADRGAYVIAERTLMAEQANPEQGLSGFVRFGMVNRDVYQSDWSGSVGLNYLGLFDGRGDDGAGIAVTVSHAGAKYRQLNASEASETAVELTYRAVLQPWLAVQPDVQFIHNPNMDSTLKDAWVAGVRIEIAL